MRIKIPDTGLIAPSRETTLVVERGELEFEYEFQSGPSEIRVSIGLKNLGKASIRLSSFTLLTILDIAEPVYYNNWQSWLPFKAYWELPEVKGLIDLADKTNLTLFNATPMPELLRKNVRPSDYFVASEELVAGFLDSSISHPYFVWDDVENTISVNVELFGKELRPGESLTLEPLMIFYDDALYAMLDKYAEKVRREKNIKFKEFDGLGWCSWYQYFTGIDFVELKKNVELLSGLRDSKGLPFKYVQLDDGYQKDIGDWLETNDKFPSLKEIAAFISGSGFVPGLWLAPFSVSETSGLFKNHPDWLGKDLAGNPKVSYNNWNKKIYALDGSNPEVVKFLKELMTGVKEAGFDYVKIDFLFAGAMPGKRFDGAMTPIQAYVNGLKTIRDTLGDGVFLLGCGAPLIPSAGLVDGMRIGPDTSPAWNGEVMDIGVPSAKFALRSTITRSFMHRKLWLNDPDTLILRSSDSSLSNNEVRLYAYTSALLDNMILDSDDIGKIDDQGIEILREALELTGGRARVFLSGSNGLFVIGTKGGTSYNSLAVVNLTDSSKNVKIPEEAVRWTGVNPERDSVEVQAHDLWLMKLPTRVKKLKRTVEYKEDGRQVNYFEEDD